MVNYVEGLNFNRTDAVKVYDRLKPEQPGLNGTKHKKHC